jgi:hypothetical protein
MKLITAEIQKKLEKNYQNYENTGEIGNVVLKFFGGSNCTWLITDIDPNGDTMHELCDIGHGFCEFGTVSLSELKALRFPPFGLPVERDRFFQGSSVQSFIQYYNEHKTLNGC